MSNRKKRNKPSSFDKYCTGKALLAAALTMPAVQMAHAEAAPERGYIAYKHLDYDDRQPGYDRISVDADAVAVMVPFMEQWSVSASYTIDTISGASPYRWTVPATLSKVDDKRKAEEISLTRYFSRGSLTVGASHSKEEDYESKALTIQGNLHTEDKNTTLTLGIGRSHDNVGSSIDPALDEKKRVTSVFAGVTQVLSPKDIAQLNISYSDGHGFFTDPYKFQDNRPNNKYQTAILGRWNHYFENLHGASQLGYRYYKDSYGIRAHTITAEYSQELSDKWTITPLVRLYTQSAADFYFENTGPVFPPGWVIGGPDPISYDQRLSAFGARTFGIKIAFQPTKDWIIDLKYEDYAQKTNWRVFGDGSKNLDPFYARMIQIGVARYF